MSDFMLSGAEWFDQLPEPVFLLQDGILRYWNLPAGSLAERAGWTLAEGTAAPEALLELVEPLAADIPLAGERWSCLGVDTDRGRLIQLRQPSQEHLLTLSRLRQIAGRMRSPLGNLIGASQLLEQQEVPRDQAHIQQYQAIQRKNYLILLRMLENMEQLGAIAEDDVPGAQTLDFGGLCAHVVRQAEGLFEEQGVRLTFAQTDGNLLVVGEQQLLCQLIYQLLSNALRATQGGGNVQVKLERVWYDRIRMTVEDSGPGFPVEQFALAFDPARAPEAFGAKGLGLGISLCRAVVQRYGGRIALMNGPGARVVVELPLCKSGGDADLGSSIGYDTCADDVMTQLADLLPWQCFTREYGAV